MSTTFGPKQRIYLDHAAASPLRQEVLAAMLPYLATEYGNPSAIHTEGRTTRLAIESARLKIARTLGIKTDGVIFTGSGTESNNLAILGHVEYLHKNGRSFSSIEVVTTKIEHPSITAVMEQLESKGVVVKYVAVTETGLIDSSSMAEALSPQTAIVTFAYVNSEVGAIQPVGKLVRKIRQYEKEVGSKIFVHLDAAQAPLWLPCGLEQLGVDCVALDAGKCGGPKGVGILGLRQTELLSAVLFGGGQEFGRRPGTENVAGIVGSAEAISLAQATYIERSERVTAVREAAIAYIRTAVPEALLNGPEESDRVANNINISIPGLDTEYAVVYLDAHGVAASTKSACAGAGGGVSQAVLTMTEDKERAKSTIRLTLGEDTTIASVQYAVDIVRGLREKMKSLTQ